MAIITVDGTPPPAQCPGIILLDPKFSDNVASIYRLAACFGVPQVWHSGARIGPEMGRRRRTRLPPEERMRGFGRVDLIRCDDPLKPYLAADALLVGVEISESSRPLHDLEHHAPLHDGRVAYVFGPEDGRIDRESLGRCHVSVQIPAFHCLNLAAAVSVVLWDRNYKLWRDHGVQPPFPASGDHRVANRVT